MAKTEGKATLEMKYCRCRLTASADGRLDGDRDVCRIWRRILAIQLTPVGQGCYEVLSRTAPEIWKKGNAGQAVFRVWGMIHDLHPIVAKALEEVPTEAG